MENVEQQAAIFSALADPTRLKLLTLLAKQEDPDALCVSSLTGLLGISQPAVSQHLRILKSARLVKGQRRGYHIHYSVDLEGFKQCQELMAEVLRSSEQTERDPCTNCDKGKGRKA